MACCAVDLDQLDRNIAALLALGLPPTALRLSTKSLPSVPLLAYTLERVGTNKVMSFTANMVVALVGAALSGRMGSAPLDILAGVPMPAAAAQHALQSVRELAGERFAEAVSWVQWLVGTAADVESYAAVATQFDCVLRINLEIDVGLHRGEPRAF
jgi:D-serine deaminase-like pyridoxal phosphate-dependent protein